MNYSIYIHLARIVLCVYYIMAITRKNRSLKKKPNGLKKKSNKSSRKSKKSRRVNKRKIRGGLLSSKLSVNKFNESTANISDIQNYGDDPDPISMLKMRMRDFINANSHIEACPRSMFNSPGWVQNCKTEKKNSYRQRQQLGEQLLNNYDEIKKDYENNNKLRTFNSNMVSSFGGPGPNGRNKVERLTEVWGEKAEEKAGETAEPPLN
jgi:hypothetical protein